MYDESITLEQATEYLRSLYAEFPFGDWYYDQFGVRQSRSLAVQIAAMLSQFVVHLLPKGANRMGFIYNANSQRSGKTLLVKMATCPVHGAVAAQTWKSDEAELSKVIDAQLLEAKTYILFDNCRGFLQSQTVEALMTSPMWTGRVLGRSQTFTVNNNVTVFITGNDCTVSSDMAYRCLLVNLFVSEAEVQDRKTSVLIDEPWLLERSNRLKILGCLWALVKSWIRQGGKPKCSSFGYKPLLGFEAWGELVGGIVAYAGFGDCLARAQVATAGDNEKRDMNALVGEMTKYFQQNKDRLEWKFDEIVKICREEELFAWAIDGRERGDDFHLTPDSKSRFGRILARYAPDSASGGRVFMLNKESYTLMSQGTGRCRRFVLDKTT